MAGGVGADPTHTSFRERRTKAVMLTPSVNKYSSFDTISIHTYAIDRSLIHLS